MKGVVNYQHSVSWILIKFSQQTLVQGKTRSKGDTTSISSQKKKKKQLSLKWSTYISHNFLPGIFEVLIEFCANVISSAQ